MQLTVSAKQIGRKHALIDKKAIDVEDIGPEPTVRDLLSAVVTQQVQEYNNKPREKNLLPFLDKNNIEDQASAGKVGFGSIYNENKVNIALACETAHQAFEDGLFAVFADELELRQLDQHFQLTTNTIITFVRLTFLAGSYW